MILLVARVFDMILDLDFWRVAFAYYFLVWLVYESS